MEEDGSSGHDFEFPNFGLLPTDYLKFADEALEYKDPCHLINCVTHLKRAAECEIDTFLYVCNLYKISEKKNLGFDTKLNFLKDVGIFNSRTLSRFNNMRNKIEHEYAVPNITDIDVYYDLISALVELLEGAMFILCRGSELGFYFEEEEKIIGRFAIQYNYEKPGINVSWKIKNEKEELSADFKDDRAEFIYFFKVLILLNKWSCLINNEVLIENL
jgi:hypothetical protein